MQAFFCPEQLRHTPQQFMRLGRFLSPPDVPERAATLRAVLARCGIALTTPRDYGRAPLAGVHSDAYLDYLEHAYSRWQALADNPVYGMAPSAEVLPNMSPYCSGQISSGQINHGERPPCPAESIIATTGYYVSDLSCPIGPHTWRAALRATHTAVAAAESVIAGASLAYALCRPSGHHAHRDRAGGFCYLNNSAAAAQTLAQHYGRVAVLDVDAHHGDGTQQIFYHRADVLTVSLHADPANYYPFYSGYAHETGHGAGLGCNLNLPLPHGADNAVFFAALETALAALRDYQPRALVLSLGFDTYKDDPISVLKLDMAAYRHVGACVARLGLPVVVVQEGGYLVSAIGAALEAFLQGLTA